ncbi:unnamed protein product [Rotaria sp. Silwood1]|nr:unnamed protein product [Rotaria sp. Silwood1]
MSSPIVHLHKALSSESLNLRHETIQQRLSLQHIFNSCVLDKYQRVNSGELIRHFRFVAEQNTDLLSIQFDFTFLLNELGGSDQQVTFDQLFNAVEKLYSQLIDESNINTSISKSISSMSLNASSSLKKRRNKENIDLHTNDDISSNSFDSRKKSNDHEKCKIEYNELLEINHRQSECLRMLEEDYKKLDDDHQHLKNQYEEIQKKKISLEENLNRNSHYINENIDLHISKNQLENSYRDLKQENECCEKEKFELQEQLIDIENQLQIIREERNQYMNRLIDTEYELKKEFNCRQQLEEQLNTMQNQLKEDNISNECVSQYLDSSNMETIDDMEVQILLSKTDSFNSIYLKDVFHELHVNGMNINEHLIILINKIQCEQDREYILNTTDLIDKHLLTIKNLIKKVIDNKDVFEGRFRKLQTLLIASRELLRDDYELFDSTSSLLPCRCLNRSRSSPMITQMKSSIKHIRCLSSPCSSIPSAMTVTTTDSGLNTSTGCTTSRSPTPDLYEDISSMTLEIDSIFNRTLTKENNCSKQINKISFQKLNRSINIKNTQSDRIKRVLKRLQWCAIITSCSIVLFIWTVIMRYYFLTSPNDDDCNRLSFAWWPFAYCSTNGITL